MKKRGSTYVPRNPYAPAAHQRKAGIHHSTEKIKRRDDRRQINDPRCRAAGYSEEC